MASNEETNRSSHDSITGEANELWKNEMESLLLQVVSLQAEFLEVKAYLELVSEEGSGKELGVLSSRVKSTAIMLQYLRSKARILAIPDLTHLSSGIEHQATKELTHIEEDISSSSEEVKNTNLLDFHGSNEDTLGSLGIEDVGYTNEMLKSMEMVTDVMESLMKRATTAEYETSIQKERVCLGEEEIRRKTVQIENLSLKLEEMERFVHGTNMILDETRVRIGELVEETRRQREKAAENEEELCRVKREFESLKSYVTTFTNVRETLLSSERQFKTIESLFERLVSKTTQLEGEKAHKEVEVQKLMEENVKLTALLDKKEAQLLALHEQCKVMALNASNF